MFSTLFSAPLVQGSPVWCMLFEKNRKLFAVSFHPASFDRQWWHVWSSNPFSLFTTRSISNSLSQCANRAPENSLDLKVHGYHRILVRCRRNKEWGRVFWKYRNFSDHSLIPLKRTKPSMCAEWRIPKETFRSSWYREVLSKLQGVRRDHRCSKSLRPRIKRLRSKY